MTLDNATVNAGEPITIHVKPAKQTPVTVWWSIDGGKTWREGGTTIAYSTTTPGPVTFMIALRNPAGQQSDSQSVTATVQGAATK